MSSENTMAVPLSPESLRGELTCPVACMWLGVSVSQDQSTGICADFLVLHHTWVVEGICRFLRLM